MQPERTVVLLSGGIDSTVLLAQLLDRNRERVEAIMFNYGQRHKRELQSAMQVCERLGVTRNLVVIDSLEPLFTSSALVDREKDVPAGEYSEESLRVTVVPNRNMIMLALATAFAANNDFHSVAYGAHHDDHAVYPDCRPDFIAAMGVAMGLCHFEPIVLEAPFCEWHTKKDIIALGNALGAPLELTWSCYRGGELHCGECSTCKARREGFRGAGVDDPTRYAS